MAPYFLFSSCHYTLLQYYISFCNIVPNFPPVLVMELLRDCTCVVSWVCTKMQHKAISQASLFQFYDLVDLQTYHSKLKRPYHVDGLGKRCFCFEIFLIPIPTSLFCHIISITILH